jgi:hypothetical protein
MDAITRRNQLESPFLRLPAEIRNQIYEHAFDRVVWVDPPTFWFPWDRKTKPPNYSEFPLLQTCRQINHEAMPIAFRNCTFNFTDAAFHFRTTLFDRPWTAAQLARGKFITHIVVDELSVCDDDYKIYDVFKSLDRPAELPALKHLEIWCSYGPARSFEEREAKLRNGPMVEGLKVDIIDKYTYDWD